MCDATPQSPAPQAPRSPRTTVRLTAAGPHAASMPYAQCPCRTPHASADLPPIPSDALIPALSSPLSHLAVHPQTCHAVAAALRARLIVALAHRADIITRSWRFLTKSPVPQHVLTLAPHVQIAMKWVHGMCVVATVCGSNRGSSSTHV